MERTCDIIIVVWNQKERTRACLDSIIKNTAVPYRVIIVDNASAEDTRAYLVDFFARHRDKTLLLRQEKNLGFIKGVNKALAQAKADYVCLINNDTIAAAGWLGEMVSLLRTHQEIGIVNPSSNTLGQNVASCDEEPLAQYARAIKASSGRYARMATSHGFCMVFRRKLYEEIGAFEERFGKGFFEDTDFSLRAKSKGYVLARACASYVYHHENTSFRTVPRYRLGFDLNRRLFETRWGRLYRYRVLLRKTYDAAALRAYLEKLVFNGSRVWLSQPRRDEKDIARDIPHVIKEPQPSFFAALLFALAVKKKKFSSLITDDEKLYEALVRCRRLIGRPTITLLGDAFHETKTVARSHH